MVMAVIVVMVVVMVIVVVVVVVHKNIISKRINQENKNIPGPKQCVASFEPIPRLPTGCCGLSVVFAGLRWPALAVVDLLGLVW